MVGSGRDAARVTRALFPELAAALDRAPDHDPVEAWISAETRRARGGGIDGLGIADTVGLSDPESRERLAAAFRSASAIAERLGIRAPAPEEFVAAGADIAALERAMRADASLSLVAAPHGLGRAAWERLFETEAEAGGPALALSSEAARWFEALDRPADPALPRVLGSRSSGGTAAGGAVTAAWTLRLVPAADEPPMLGVPYARGSHPSLPEMFILQLARHTAELPPVDTHTFTWIAGTLPAADFAARHTYDATEHTVRIGCRGRADQGPHVGIRPPVPRPSA